MFSSLQLYLFTPTLTCICLCLFTDGDCFYPLRREDAAAFSRSEAEAHRPANVVQLQDSSIPEEIKCFLEDVKGDFQCWATPEPTQNNAEGAAAAASAANQTNRLCIAAGKPEPHTALTPAAEAHPLLLGFCQCFCCIWRWFCCLVLLLLCLPLLQNLMLCPFSDVPAAQLLPLHDDSATYEVAAAAVECCCSGGRLLLERARLL